MKSEDEVRRVVRDLCACYTRRHGRVLPRTVHGLGRDRRDGRRSVVHDRRAHRQPSDAEEGDGRRRGARRDGQSRAVLQAALGVRPEHLAYPVGDPTSAGPREFRIAAELGFKTAVTTRPGVLFTACIASI